MKKFFMKLLEKLLPQHDPLVIESPFQALTPTDDAEDIKTQKIILAEREAKLREREELIAAREQKLKELIS